MFPIKSELLKVLHDEDILYHYTKASTAIDYILFNQQLKFSKPSYSSDPIESEKAIRSTVYFDKEVDREQTNEEAKDVNCIHKYVEDLETNFYQICFCKNTFDENNEHISNFQGNEEFFGFTKYRMWDQYADKYTGVCIAFSKSKILDKNEKRLNLICRDIDYLTFDEIRVKKIVDIQGNYLINVGLDKYKDQLKKQILESLFIKHKDYSSENEFRIGIFFDKIKASSEIKNDEDIFNQSMMLDITDCIKAIFISSYVNEKQKLELLNYAYKLDVDLIEMKWGYNKFEAIDCKDEIKFFNQFKNN